MKRETKRWVERQRCDERYPDAAIRALVDILASDAKLRAENRDLKARLKAALLRLNALLPSNHWKSRAPALDLKNKNWRKR